MLLLWGVTSPQHLGVSLVLVVPGRAHREGLACCKELCGAGGSSREMNWGMRSPAHPVWAQLGFPAAPLGWLVTNIPLLVGTGKGWRVQGMWGGLVAVSGAGVSTKEGAEGGVDSILEWGAFGG